MVELALAPKNHNNPPSEIEMLDESLTIRHVTLIRQGEEHAAIAAKVAFPKRTVVCFAGDGDFQMNCQELGTAMQAGAQPIILIVNNGIYGTIRAHQERNYPARVSGTTMVNPDFVALARAYGYHAERVALTAEFPAAFERALNSKTGAVLDLDISPEAITPRAGEWVLGKTRASAFFQTPLTSYLVQQHVDTLVFCGVSTSGCVRASVVDGFSHGFQTFVVDECCFDRSPFAHAANLFDMEAKYASVVSLGELAKLMPAAAATKAA